MEEPFDWKVCAAKILCENSYDSIEDSIKNYLKIRDSEHQFTCHEDVMQFLGIIGEPLPERITNGFAWAGDSHRLEGDKNLVWQNVAASILDKKKYEHIDFFTRRLLGRYAHAIGFWTYPVIEQVVSFAIPIQSPFQEVENALPESLMNTLARSGSRGCQLYDDQSPRMRVALIAGHGSWEKNFGFVTIPSGCTVTLLGPPGSGLCFESACFLERIFKEGMPKAVRVIKNLRLLEQVPDEGMYAAINDCSNPFMYPLVIAAKGEGTDADQMTIDGRHALMTALGCEEGQIPNYELSEDVHGLFNYFGGAGLIRTDDARSLLLRRDWNVENLELVDLFEKVKGDTIDFVYSACSTGRSNNLDQLRMMEQLPGHHFCSRTPLMDSLFDNMLYTLERRDDRVYWINRYDSFGLRVVRDDLDFGQGLKSLLKCFDYVYPPKKGEARGLKSLLDHDRCLLQENKTDEWRKFAHCIASCFGVMICVLETEGGDVEALESLFYDHDKFDSLRGETIYLLCVCEFDDPTNFRFFPLEPPE